MVMGVCNSREEHQNCLPTPRSRPIVPSRAKSCRKPCVCCVQVCCGDLSSRLVWDISSVVQQKTPHEPPSHATSRSNQNACSRGRRDQEPRERSLLQP
jgi:hypothetical protein